MPLEYDDITAGIVCQLFDGAEPGRSPTELANFLDFVVQLVLVGYGGRKFFFYDNQDIEVPAKQIGLLADLFSHLGLGSIRGEYFLGGDRPPQSDTLLFGMNKRKKDKGVIWGQIISKKGTRWTARNDREVQKALGMTVLSSGDDWASRELDRLSATVYFGGVCLFAQVVPMRDEKELDATVRNAIALCDKWSNIWNTTTGGLGLDWKFIVQTAISRKHGAWLAKDSKIVHVAH